MYHMLFIYVNLDPSDYMGGTYPVEFPSGETTVTVMIPLEDDEIDECTEVFTGKLQLLGKSGDGDSPEVSVGSDDTASINIKDGDSKCFTFEEKVH